MSLSSVIGNLLINKNESVYGKLLGKSTKTGIKTYIKAECGKVQITSLKKDGSLLKVIKKDYFSKSGCFDKETGHTTNVKNFKNNTETSIETSITILLSKTTNWFGRSFGHGDKIKKYNVYKYDINTKNGSSILKDSNQMVNKLNDKTWVYRVHTRPQLSITKKVTEWHSDLKNAIQTGFHLYKFKTPSGNAIKTGTIGREKGILYPHTSGKMPLNKSYQIGFCPNEMEIQYN